MNEAMAGSVLKILGIATVLVGVILTAQALLVWMMLPAGSAASGLGTFVQVEGVVSAGARVAVLCHALIMAFGFLLCAASPALARYVACRGSCTPPGQPPNGPGDGRG